MKNDHEIYLEIRKIGNIAKITAIHAASGTEVSISGPANTDIAILEKNVLAKLEYVMNKRSNDDDKFTKN